MDELKEKKVPINVSFSVKHDSTHILEEFNKKIRDGDLNKSAVFVRMMENYLNNNKSVVEKIFDNYCSQNHLSKDAQLKLLMGPYRVSNDGGASIWEDDEEQIDFFEQMKRNRDA